MRIRNMRSMANKPGNSLLRLRRWKPPTSATTVGQEPLIRLCSEPQRIRVRIGVEAQASHQLIPLLLQMTYCSWTTQTRNDPAASKQYLKNKVNSQIAKDFRKDNRAGHVETPGYLPRRAFPKKSILPSTAQPSRTSKTS